MGESMCERVITAGGHQPVVYDTQPGAVAKLVARGAKGAASAAEVGRQSTHIILMVPNSEHVTAVVEELLPVLAPGTVVIDMSTIAPAVSIGLAQKVAQTGSVMLDAPVVKSKPAAISGDLGILVGGDAGTFEAVLPLLRCMGKNVIRMGGNGAGLAMKLCHNMLVANIQNGVHEMLTLAEACGLAFDDTVKAISYGGGQNFYLDSKAATLQARDFAPKFPFRHMQKDLTLAGSLVASHGLELGGLAVAQRVYEQGTALGLGGEDFSAALKVVAQMARETAGESPAAHGPNRIFSPSPSLPTGWAGWGVDKPDAAQETQRLVRSGGRRAEDIVGLYEI